MQLIYVVEDHDVIRKGIGSYLENSGFRTALFANLESVKKALKEQSPDLIIQDIMLPDGDGSEFIKELRKTSTVPVIFMTARVAEADRLHGFEIGADDYITKPFSPKELVLRVQAVLRRTSGIQKPALDLLETTFSNQVDRLYICEKNHALLLNKTKLDLTAAEWRILTYMIKNKDRIVTREEILSNCFDYKSESYTRIADTHVKNLRAKFGTSNWIETVRGFGYRFTGREVDLA